MGCRWLVAGGRWRVGGWFPQNTATAWPHLASWYLPDFQLYWGKKLQLWSLYKETKDTIPFIYQTKLCLRDIRLQRYFVNNFINFQRKLKIYIFLKISKSFLLLSHQPKISQGPFYTQNEWENNLYHLIWSLLKLLYKLSNKAIKMLQFENLKKCPTSGVRCTP